MAGCSAEPPGLRAPSSNGAAAVHQSVHDSILHGSPRGSAGSARDFVQSGWICQRADLRRVPSFALPHFEVAIGRQQCVIANGAPIAPIPLPLAPAMASVTDPSCLFCVFSDTQWDAMDSSFDLGNLRSIHLGTGPAQDPRLSPPTAAMNARPRPGQVFGEHTTNIAATATPVRLQKEMSRLRRLVSS
jgi:hypothetical protein